MKNKDKIVRLTTVAILAALVVILQMIASSIRIGPVSISLVLIPIVVGAALHGPYAGAVLGLVFAAVAIYGEAMGGMFWAISIPGTIAICTVKGVCCGAAAGLVYKLFEKKDRTAAAFAAAVTCPIVNTGLFLVGCFTLFSSALDGWALAAGYATVIKFILVGIICTNFIPELLINVLLSPAIVTIIKNARKAH